MINRCRAETTLRPAGAQRLYAERQKTIQQTADMFGEPPAMVYGHLRLRGSKKDQTAWNQAVARRPGSSPPWAWTTHAPVSGDQNDK